MPMIYLSTKPEMHWTIQDVAERSGLPYARIWKAIYEMKTLPRPKIRSGRRYYYAPEAAKEVLAQLKQMKNEL
jgi:hypothetical protein